MTLFKKKLFKVKRSCGELCETLWSGVSKQGWMKKHLFTRSKISFFFFLKCFQTAILIGMIVTLQNFDILLYFGCFVLIKHSQYQCLDMGLTLCCNYKVLLQNLKTHKAHLRNVCKKESFGGKNAQYFKCQNCDFCNSLPQHASHVCISLALWLPSLLNRFRFG